MTIELDRLPSPADRRLAVRVTPDALRQIRGGHPWIYDQAITSISHDGAPGDLAVVFDDKREFAAIGLWDPDSPIRIKVLHAGRPQTVDAEFWSGRLEEAIALRAPLIRSEETDAYRLVHGENDRLPGLVVDRYADVIVIKLYTAAWIPHLLDLVNVVVAREQPETIVLRMARNLASGETHGLAEGMTLFGPDAVEPVMFRENGLRFEASPTNGQKTGHFLDQRDNRAAIRDAAEGKTVLDVFSCTGGFSVHAAAGGARSVLSIDLSPHAIATAQRNMKHNYDLADVAACRHEGAEGDAFNLMNRRRDDGSTYDIVIVDPPSFAQRQASVDGAIRAYARLTDLALDLVTPGGLLFQASCSSRVPADDFYQIVSDTAAGRGITLHELARTGHAPDHPIGFAQGAYLKALFARVER